VLLLLRLPADKLQGALAVSRGHLRDLRDGFARVIRTRPLLTVLVVWTIVLGAIASTQTAQVFLAKDAFHAGDFGYGLIFGCVGLGLAIGSFGAGTWLERRPIGTVYSGSILLQAIGIAATTARNGTMMKTPRTICSVRDWVSPPKVASVSASSSSRRSGVAVAVAGVIVFPHAGWLPTQP